MEALRLTDLKVHIGESEILHGMDFVLRDGVRLGIVGESGSGKTMMVRSLMGLLPVGAAVQGSLQIDGSEVNLTAKEKAWRQIRGAEIGMVMQDPFTALDPLTKCGAQILAGVSKARRGAFDVAGALAEVGLPEKTAGQYPHELSGGMRQRVVIAAALATEPKILIADEATTALDVIIQAEILDLIEEIRRKRGMPLILISHDIKLVQARTDQILVVKEGRIVERGLTKEVTQNPQDEYTKQLIAADAALMPAAVQKESEPRVILEATNLTKTFGSFKALDNVNIRVLAGEFVGVVGQSGSGKTTLARVIAGLTEADEGEVLYHGAGYPQMVFQDPYSSLNPAHTVRHTLTEALTVSGQPVSDLEELLRITEIPAELLDKKPRALSGGQRQRVAIARALAPRPELLLCDESVSALDILTRNAVLATLEGLREKRGLAILFITHDLSVVKQLASRIYVMHDARVTEEGTPEKIFHDTQDAYTARLIAASFYGQAK